MYLVHKLSKCNIAGLKKVSDILYKCGKDMDTYLSPAILNLLSFRIKYNSHTSDYLIYALRISTYLSITYCTCSSVKHVCKGNVISCAKWL